MSACFRRVIDEKEIHLKELTWAVGAKLPEATDFVVSLPKDATIRFAEEYSFSKTGEYTLDVIISAPNAEDVKKAVQFNLVFDDEAPKMDGVKDISVYIGDGVSYRSGITVTDNCGGNVTLEVDSSRVDLTAEGVYPITYYATDAAGNRTIEHASVYVYQLQVTKEMLNREIERIGARIITEDMTKEQKAREIYDYVHNSITYASTSDKNDWVRAAYDGIQNDVGDCFTYFALSKAFFNYYGIDNMDIQRTAGLVDDTHFWNFVNIGTAQNPRWYHFDACRMLDKEHNGCLITDEQLQYFHNRRVDDSGVTNYFYAYDPTAYPKTATEIITR
jgi:hypothetical protein